MQGVQIPSSARAAAGLSNGHCLANSHSPHLEEGLLAQSLETHMPNFGMASTPSALAMHVLSALQTSWSKFS